jgi:hypothetical protein
MDIFGGNLFTETEEDETEENSEEI